MIKFSCPHCSHKIGAPDDYAGKKARCSKCKQPLRIPAAARQSPSPDVIKFRCDQCNQKIAVAAEHVGKRVKCKKCANICIVAAAIPVIEPAPAKAIPDAPLRLAEDETFGQDVLNDQMDLSELAQGQAIETEKPVSDEAPEERLTDPRFADSLHEVPPERTLPWPIDVLLYPFSKGGAAFFAIAIGLPLLINLIIWWFERLGDTIPTFYLFAIVCIFLSFIVKVVILLYTFWYFCHCMRDSSDGRLRAPDVLADNPTIGELFGQILRMDLCFAIMASPVILYISAPLKPFMPKIMFTWPFFLLGLTDGSPQSGAEMYAFFVRNELHFFTLVGISIFFLPMAWLATVMFDSIRGLNPITLIASVFGTFFRYLPVAAVFYIPIVVMIAAVKFLVAFSFPMLIGTLMLKVLMIYLLTVNSHLLGRFYYLNQEKLYWEV